MAELVDALTKVGRCIRFETFNRLDRLHITGSNPVRGTKSLQMKIFNEELLTKINCNFTPGKFEPRYQVTQLFETGIQVTYWFVIRKEGFYYYDEKIERIF